jgi:hypothetical protein
MPQLTEMSKAIAQGKIKEITKIIAKSGPDILGVEDLSCQIYPLEVAVFCGKKEVVATLLAASRTEQNTLVTSDLILFAIFGARILSQNHDKANDILAYVASLNTTIGFNDGSTKLHMAAITGPDSLIEKTLKEDPKLAFQLDSSGRFPLVWAYMVSIDRGNFLLDKMLEFCGPLKRDAIYKETWKAIASLHGDFVLNVLCPFLDIKNMADIQFSPTDIFEIKSKNFLFSMDAIANQDFDNRMVLCANILSRYAENKLQHGSYLSQNNEFRFALAAYEMAKDLLEQCIVLYNDSNEQVQLLNHIEYLFIALSHCNYILLENSHWCVEVEDIKDTRKKALVNKQRVAEILQQPDLQEKISNKLRAKGIYLQITLAQKLGVYYLNCYINSPKINENDLYDAIKYSKEGAETTKRLLEFNSQQKLFQPSSRPSPLNKAHVLMSQVFCAITWGLSYSFLQVATTARRKNVTLNDKTDSISLSQDKCMSYLSELLSLQEENNQFAYLQLLKKEYDHLYVDFKKILRFKKREVMQPILDSLYQKFLEFYALNESICELKALLVSPHPPADLVVSIPEEEEVQPILTKPAVSRRVKQKILIQARDSLQFLSSWSKLLSSSLLSSIQSKYVGSEFNKIFKPIFGEEVTTENVFSTLTEIMTKLRKVDNDNALENQYKDLAAKISQLRNELFNLRSRFDEYMSLYDKYNNAIKTNFSQYLETARSLAMKCLVLQESDILADENKQTLLICINQHHEIIQGLEKLVESVNKDQDIEIIQTNDVTIDHEEEQKKYNLVINTVEQFRESLAVLEKNSNHDYAYYRQLEIQQLNQKSKQNNAGLSAAKCKKQKPKKHAKKASTPHAVPEKKIVPSSPVSHSNVSSPSYWLKIMSKQEPEMAPADATEIELASSSFFETNVPQVMSAPNSTRSRIDRWNSCMQLTGVQFFSSPASPTPSSDSNSSGIVFAP